MQFAPRRAVSLSFQHERKEVIPDISDREAYQPPSDGRRALVQNSTPH
jgi:hypothetical protein